MIVLVLADDGRVQCEQHSRLCQFSFSIGCSSQVRLLEKKRLHLSASV